MLRVLANTLDAEPTVDAVPVTRCRDCIRGKDYNKDTDIVWCNNYVVEKVGSAYCEHGYPKNGKG